MNASVETSWSFIREHLRAPLTLALLVAVPVFFVLIFASVLGDFSRALGGSLAGHAAAAISAGWAAAFLCGTLAFFQVSSSRGADRRLALAGLGTWQVASARIGATVALGLVASCAAFVTLWLNSGIAHPLHAALAILAFALVYIGIGAVVGAFVVEPLEGSLIVVLVFAVDAFSGPSMTSGGGVLAHGPTRGAAELLIAAGTGTMSSSGDWLSVGATAAVALAAALAAFWMVGRPRAR